jgi:large subunit ribosomal protein L24
MGQDIGAKRESEVPLPLADVRLVIPYELTKDNRKIFSDVIVDNIVLERHITGVDPFTFTDYGDAEFPPEHRYDPKTGLPIFHRYIAGTRQRIEWPWEHSPEIEDRGVTEEDAPDKQTWFRKTLSTLRHPIDSYKGLTSSSSEVSTKKDSTPEPIRKEELEEIELEEKERLRKPKGQDIHRNEAYDNTDTTRNIVETAESIQYRLITPPFPEALGQELRSDIQDLVIESSKDKDGSKSHSKKLKKITQHARAHSEKDKAKRIAAERMKTPMQLRWEKDHAKKLQEREKTPLVTTEALMAALGQHMQKTQASPWKPKRHAAKTQELD